MAIKRRHRKQSYKRVEITQPKKGSSLQTVYNRWKAIIWVSIISFLATSIYFQTYRFDYTQDDITYTIENSATQKGLNGIPDIFTHGSLNYYNLEPTNTGIYRPITLLTFCLEHALFKGFNPMVGHIINAILYFFVLFFVGLILIKFFSERKYPLLLPLLMLLLYSFHPIHTEVVASIKSRETLLCALFLFASLYLWLQHITSDRLMWKLFVGLLFFLGLLSKEEGITFVAVVVLISYVFYKMSVLRSIKETIPFLISALVYLVIRFSVLDKPSDIYNSILNNVIYSLNGQERLATNLYVYLYYVKLLFYPFPLSVDYSFSQITPKTFSDGWVIFSLLFFLFLVVLSIKKLRRRTIIAFGLLYYLSTFSIFSNFTEDITIGSTIGERFMFLPSLGFCIVLVYGLYLLAKRINGLQFKVMLLAIIIPISLIYSIKSFYRTEVWNNNMTLFQSGLKTAPKSWRVHSNLAEASFGRAEKITSNPSVAIKKADSAKYWYQLAKREFETAFDIIKEQGNVPYLNYMHYGKVLFSLKDTAGAMFVYRRATALTSNLSSAWSNLGTIFYYENKFDSAIYYYQKALTANSPDFFSTYKNMGSSYLMIKDYQNSIKAYESALHYGKDQEIVSNLSFLYSAVGNLEKADQLTIKTGGSISNSDQLKNLMNAGIGAYTQGDYADAVKYLSQCESFYNQNGGYKRYPDFFKAWGGSLLKLNEPDAAKTIFNKLLKEDSKNYSALQNLGLIAYQNEKNYAKATEYFMRCLKSESPDYLFVFTSLGFLYRIQNMPDKAIESFENSLKYGSSKIVINNLYQLWQAKGNQEKMNFYQTLLNKQ